MQKKLLLPKMTGPDQQDASFILSRIDSNGGNFWATKDNGIGKGSPFSTKDVGIILHELGFKKKHAVIQGIGETILAAWHEDGRFKIAPSGGIYPCHTIGSVRVLCYLGYSKDRRVKKSFKYLMETQEDDGGWKCNKFSFGRGPETKHSNPGPTLEALDAFRYTSLVNTDDRLNNAVEFLLWHWKNKKPAGPCMFGIGSLFMQTEFPFFRYNLFYFCYVLSFYKVVKGDVRFRQAVKALSTKLIHDEIIVENPNRQLSNLNLCRKGQPSTVATRRYRELLANLE